MYTYFLNTQQMETFQFFQKKFQITLYMEMENIRFGKEKGYEGIFTTNANRLTQHISRILGYQILSTIQVKIIILKNIF